MGSTEADHLLGSQSPTRDQIVLHLDMDCFFAACERLRNPDLEGEPLVIGGGFDSSPPRGAVATASYEAREYGVHSAQPISTALQNLPRRSADNGVDSDGRDEPTGIYLKGDHSFYGEVSSQVMAIVEEYADTIRRVSIDEAYLDITDETTWEAVTELASELKTRIAEDVGVVASIGVAPTMSCAKVASDHDKPDGLCIVRPGDVAAFLAPLDIEEIHGVGPRGAEAFRSAGIETAGDLAALSVQEVVDRFGSNATKLYDRVRGIDPRAVEPVGEPKSISKEKSIEPTSSMETKQSLIERLGAQVNERVERTDARYRTVGIKVVETPFDVNTRERSLHGPVREPELVHSIASELLEEFRDREVRKLGVRVSNLEFFSGDQLRISAVESKATDDTAGTSTQRRLGQTRLTDFQ
jgi:DNA polymerase IV (DinB-like DNA polymerase)